MPTITSLAPTSGPSTGGTSVVITGTGFGGATTVLFDSTATTFTLDSDTRITAIAPGGAVGAAQVTVTDANGVSNAVTYDYLAVPALTDITPSQGATAGGTTVVLTGAGLTDVTAVDFGGTPATSFTVDSDTQITAVTPAGTGIAAVTVTAPGGVSGAVTYVYVVVPNVTAVSPASGAEAGGTAVTITGTDFSGPLTVRFGGTATSFTIDSDTQITAVAPPGTGTVQVTVAGTGGAGTGVVYTYI
ncbi:IPT/TIG domain-containing protein [Nocardia bovistercoris]|uniref:IPT/TIG domain-containing protein n=1 Tax=Nocardia bovistercoris TaxID=2785916 RepID=A0A931N366_9NOCA|nr:IPT/TIG domain-containing protein [Nocardia bovistercoris]MBH0776811.1 IPT/TIG domain-containing protein [Nocardia bovistercoris]